MTKRKKPFAVELCGRLFVYRGDDELHTTSVLYQMEMIGQATPGDENFDFQKYNYIPHGGLHNNFRVVRY